MNLNLQRALRDMLSCALTLMIASTSFVTAHPQDVFATNRKVEKKNSKLLIAVSETPIVGILTQELTDQLKVDYPRYAAKGTYIAASYIKFVEAAGARAVPVFTHQPDEYYEMIFNSTNGLLIPGGDVSTEDSGKLA